MSDQPTLTPGTLVLCTYRAPLHLQECLGEILIGTIEEPGDDPATWNGKNSERDYCTALKYARVRYPFGVMHDRITSLVPITPEQAALPLPEKNKLYLKLAREARDKYDGPFLLNNK